LSLGRRRLRPPAPPPEPLPGYRPRLRPGHAGVGSPGRPADGLGGAPGGDRPVSGPRDVRDRSPRRDRDPGRDVPRGPGLRPPRSHRGAAPRRDGRRARRAASEVARGARPGYNSPTTRSPRRRLMTEETTPSVRDKVQELLDTAINPAVAGHGGYIELLDVKDSTVYLRMSGGCQGCGAADVTLKSGIERMIFEEVPEITEVLDVTDHGAGTNPYYAPSKG